MKDKFPGYFKRSEEEHTRLYETAIYALDANFLLDLYRYSEATRKEVLNLLRKVKDRIFVPHQAALEFLRNRLDVIADQEKSYDATLSTLTRIDAEFNNPKRHPFISGGSLTNLNSLFGTLRNELESARSSFQDLATQDAIQEEIANLLEGSVGEPYGKDRLTTIYKEGEQRFLESVPPGYKDNDKPAPRKFGDLIIWFQIIDQAIAQQKSAILITAETKEDWWWIFRGKTVGPRHELVAEFYEKTQKEFHIYPPDRFVDRAGKYHQQNVAQTVIDEVKDLGQQSKIEDLTKGEGSVGISSTNLANLFSSSDDLSGFASVTGDLGSLDPLPLNSPALRPLVEVRPLLLHAMRILMSRRNENYVAKAGLKLTMQRLQPGFSEMHYGFLTFSALLDQFPDDIITYDNLSGGHVGLRPKALFGG